LTSRASHPRGGSAQGKLLLRRDLLEIPTSKPILKAQIVASLFVAAFCNGEPALEQIAPRLHVSPRTLHLRSMIKERAFGASNSPRVT
jgi:hypothetical protein